MAVPTFPHRGRNPRPWRSRTARTLCLGLALVVIAAGCDWAQFGGNPAHTGFQSSEDTLTPAAISRLGVSWSGATGGPVSSSPAVVAGVAYVGSSDGNLYAFSATGADGCSGTPLTCAPLWTGAVGGDVGISSPAVVNDVVYIGKGAGNLDAFDATGTTGCSGTPKTCTPLWTGTTGPIDSSPTVAEGIAYVNSLDGNLYAFDATGTQGCSGTPTVCAPLWTAPSGDGHSSPAVANGKVYVGGNAGGTDAVLVFDAAGSTDCAGTPTVCSPLWTAPVGATVDSPPTVSGSVLYVGSQDQNLYAFDAAGSTGCSGTPTVCAPLWTAATGPLDDQGAAVANGVVYIGGDNGTFYAFDAAGTDNCAGTPKVCTPLWTATASNSFSSSPTVADGVVYVGNRDGTLYAYDAGGVNGCSDTPTACVPLWSFTTKRPVMSSPVVANGALYLSSGDGSLYSFQAALQPCASGPSGWGPCDIQNAYRLPSYVDGAGQTVGIVDAYDDPNAEADLAVYRSTYGLAPCTTANGCFRKLNQNGVAGSYPRGNSDWAVEISLDLDMVSASCPHCSVVLIEAKSNSNANLAAGVDQAAAQGATVISNSYGGSEFSGESSLASHYVHSGVQVVASSGDDGYAAGPQFPAAIPSVTAVGGTTLSGPLTSTSGRSWSETVWSRGSYSAGSGCSQYMAKPAYQTDTGCTQRTIADVSAVADGLAVYDTYSEPGWMLVGGTSASSPLISGVFALGGSSTSNSAVYANAASFYDVTTGNNGTCSGSYLCTGAPGYDGPTGTGTPCGLLPYATLGGCGGSASPAAATGMAPQLAPVAPESLVPVCGPVPPGYARCLSYVARGH